MTPSKVRLSAEAVYEQRKALVRQMMEKESAALDAKTARLKALRLARDEAQPPVAPAGKKKAAPDR